MSAQHYQSCLSVFNGNYSCISSLQPAINSVWILNFYVGFLFLFFWRDYWREVSKLEMVASCPQFYTLRYQCWWSHVKFTGEFEKCWKVVFFSFHCEASECLLFFPGGAAGEMMMCSRIEIKFFSLLPSVLWRSVFSVSGADHGPQQAHRSTQAKPLLLRQAWPDLPRVQTQDYRRSALTHCLCMHTCARVWCLFGVCVCERERECVCERERESVCVRER